MKKLNTCTAKIDTKADEDAIKIWFDRYVTTVKSGDMDGYRAFWSEDVVWLPPNQSIIQGVEACMDMAQHAFEQHIIDLKYTLDEILLADRMAIVRVSFIEKLTPKADASPEEIDGKEIFILKRKSDGSWVSTHCIWNSNISPSQ